MESTIVFIEGQYLSLIAKHLYNEVPLKFSISKFARYLSKSQNLWHTSTYYYTAPPFQSPVPNLNEIERRRRYDNFVNKLHNPPYFVVRQGRCQKLGKEYKQKGVDALFSADLSEIPKKMKLKTVILLACDTDFVPIIDNLRSDDIDTILFYYTDNIRKSKFSMSNYIFNACPCKVLLTKEYFEKFKL